MTDEEYRKKFIADAKIKYPFFVRDEMTLDELGEEMAYYFKNIKEYIGGENGYKSLYEQRTGKSINSDGIR